MAHTILRVSVTNGDGDGREDGFAESEDRSLIGGGRCHCFVVVVVVVFIVGEFQT